MARNHTCQDSDHISKLAADGGFAHWRTVWDENGSLSSRRSNPNLLFKGDRTHPQGDTVRIPDLDPGSADAATEAHHPFTTGSDKLFLRLRILKDDFTALANAHYTLTVAGAVAPFTGNTNGQGQLEHEIPRAATSGTLTVRASAPASGGGGVTAEAPITWQLQIGRLNPIMEAAPNTWCISGVQQRLNNLGISTGPIDGIKGPLTEAAIRVFQRIFDLSVDGKPGQGETQPKLRDAHDKPDSVLGPKPVPNDSQRQATPDDAIGHVAPDFDDRRVFNTLRLRSTYRLTLRLGSIEDLFPHAPDTAEGRMERLQVLGMFYFPLRHREAGNAFNGRAAAGGNPAVRGVWEYFKTRILDAADDAAADTEVQRLLREWVVNGGALPPAADEGTAPANANFAKLHQPGGHALLVSWRDPALNLNRDPRAPYNNWTLGRTHYEVESRFREENRTLGRVPLIARVERFDQSTAEWQPAPDATVYFQLLDPYPLPAFVATDPVNTQFNRPPLRDSSLGPPVAAAGTAGPAAFAGPEENPTGARAPQATDPQRGNCPHDRGGIQGHGNLDNGSDVAGHVFRVESTAGFNAAHTAPASGTINAITRTVFFPLAERVNDADRKHCVKAKTNAEGEAGVIFTPSRCGGDRYRFRAFLGPPTINGPGADGQGDTAVRVDTGTLVNWRSLRISRFVQQPFSAVDATLIADAQANSPGFTINLNHGGTAVFPNVTNANDYLQRAYVVDAGGTNRGLPPISLSFDMPAAGAAGFDPVPVQFARAFVEIEIDRAAQGALPETLGNDDWEAARAQAVRDAQAHLGTLGLNLDLNRLFYMGASKPATLTVANAVVHLPMRSVADYNGPAGAPAVPATQRIRNTGANNPNRIGDLVGNYLVPGFMRSLSFNGYTPGLTLVQAAYNCTWVLFSMYNDSSGESFDYRAAAIWAGAVTYPTAPIVPTNIGLPWANYGGSSNMCHEMGHDLFCLHANPPEPGNAIRHDPAGSNRSVCVMSYQNCEGHFCAKCLFALRGWNLAQLTY